MKADFFTIDSVPAVLYGCPSEKVCLFIHGKCGCKEEGELFAEYARRKGWQVLAVDLPEHGARKGETDTFNPWHAVPELKQLISYAQERYQKFALRANSIGAWFSMLAFPDVRFEKCLFVSPILDMELLIRNMMQFASVSEEQLKREKVIPTAFGETLSFQYLEYAASHPITRWESPTEILYAGRDNLTSRETVSAFAKRFSCGLTVMEEGEHWFHTPEQLAVLNQWTEAHL